MMNKTIGIFAHVDAGKTTFSEQLLFHTQSIKKKGRVDHQDAFLDSHTIEKERGITVFSDQAKFSYQNASYFLIDTPGHVGFSPEMERAIQVIDYAIILISAVEGIEGHTETIWQLLRKYQIPTFFFINKMDREGANVSQVFEDIKTHFTNHICDITQSFKQRNMDEHLIEQIAEYDERLLEIYFTEGYNQALWLQTFKTLIKAHQLFPVAYGSALHDQGILEFLDQFHHLTETHYDTDAPFSARVYKIRHDEHGNRITFIKILSGTLHVRDEISFWEKEDRITEKVTEIRSYHGKTYQVKPSAQAGEIIGVVGLSSVQIGDGLGDLMEKQHFHVVPTLRSRIIYDPTIHPKDMLACLKMLEAEDPSLQVVWDEYFKSIYIHIMGKIQLEILQKLIKERFQYDVSFAQPEILYKETITTPVIGCGHFEPLKHYAEVHLKLEPAPRGTGIIYENKCHPDDLSIGHQNVIKQHLFERDHHGLLTGSRITDMKISLLTGRAHPRHTQGGDFREATYRALRQGLEQAENIILEPYYDFKIKVHMDYIGRVMADIQKAHGTFSPMETNGDMAILKGRVPVATFLDYHETFTSFTQGKGILSFQFGGYDLCHNPDDVIAQISYDKDADPEYSSSSIFIKHGVGYTVPWDEAKKLMHIEPQHIS